MRYIRRIFFEDILKEINILEYYGHVIIIIQKLLYLYGWTDSIYADSGVLNYKVNIIIKIAAGIMFEVEEAEKIFADIVVCKGNFYCVEECINEELEKMVEEIVSKVCMKAIRTFMPITTAEIGNGFCIGRNTRIRSSFMKNAERLRKYLETFHNESLLIGRRVSTTNN